MKNSPKQWRCLSECQSSFLKANHNVGKRPPASYHVVYQNVKVRFWKQITTNDTFLCKSASCLSECQSSFLKANHNYCDFHAAPRHVVYQNVKVRFWKQITTRAYAEIPEPELFIRMSKFVFESKSQPVVSDNVSVEVVYQNVKVRFWKQITTILRKSLIPPMLFIRMSQFVFESKSQPCRACRLYQRRCLSECQSSFLKANHNHRPPDTTRSGLFIRMSKFVFESKSQPRWPCNVVKFVVYQNVKVRFWK